MSDRTSARLLGRIFRVLAINPEEYAKVAKNIYMREVPTGDFSPDQMEADIALEFLGLARQMTPEEAEQNLVDSGFIYSHENGF